MPTHPVYRAARAVVFATVCVGLAITGHMMISGAPVPPLAAAGGLLGLTVMGAALAGTERSLATILGGLLGGQFMLHALFTAAQQGQHLTHGSPMSPSSGGAAMTFVHVAAAIVSAWWLRRGERAVWGLAKRVAAGLVRRVVLPSPSRVPAPPSPVAATAGVLSPRKAFLRHVVVRRGPPAPFAALV
ncbi:hypothetical protein [Actinomadura sp. DC4]|uniref:hypothetical protein n=1 Tax=Actinomadura sp. DC4 TaxID=3055069 RepID=UPI0025B04B5C|nr:hypothetical protein [Actinomadura sp. DC4]MDN3351832.1 hypothetical protein [Actinomadura sp. DC4]